VEQRNLWTKSVCLSATEIAPADCRAEKDYWEELNRDGLGGPRKSFARTHLSDARTHATSRGAHRKFTLLTHQQQQQLVYAVTVALERHAHLLLY
jgi:hypothetical protein